MKMKSMLKLLASNWTAFRRCKHLVIFSFCLAVFADHMLWYLQTSLAPSLIRSMRYDRCSCPNLSRGSVILVGHNESVYKTKNDTAEHYFCPKNDNSSCLSAPEVLAKTALGVDALNGVGPLLQVLSSPIIGLVVSKVGHRWPFLFGSAIQVCSTGLFVFSSQEWLYYLAAALEGVGNTFIFISGFTMITCLFEGAERTKILSTAFGTAVSLAALLTFPIGGLLYDVSGIMVPFGIAAILAVTDAVVRLVLDARSPEEIAADDASRGLSNETSRDVNDKGSSGDNSEMKQPVKAEENVDRDSEKILSDKGDKKCYNSTDVSPDNSTEVTSDKSPIVRDDTEGDEQETKDDDKNGSSFLRLFKDATFIKMIVTVFLYAVILTFPLATAYNFSINVLNGQQWELGVVITTATGLQVIITLTLGRLLKKENIWIYVLVGNIFQIICLITYPLCPSIWWTLFPECAIRGVAYFVGLAVVPNLYHFLLEERHPNASSKVFSMVNVAFTSGYAVGPQLGNLLVYVSFMHLYFIVAGVIVVPATILGLHLSRTA